MTFKEAIIKSMELQNDALLAIALKSPDRREKLSKYVQFNPYLYMRNI